VWGPHIDADRIGVAGHSQGGFTSLWISGARINPDLYLAYQTGWRNNPVVPAHLRAELPLDAEPARDVRDSRIKAAFAMAPGDIMGFGMDADGLRQSILKARTTVLRDMGAAMSPFNAFMFIQGVETLPLRMRQHCSNASAVASYLSKHPKVARVIFPGLMEGEPRRYADAYLKGGHSSLLGFELKGGRESGQKFIDALKMFCHVANIGDARSLAIHPATTTHSQLTPEEQSKTGVTDGYVRLSVGIEHPDDILSDLGQALAVAQLRELTGRQLLLSDLPRRVVRTSRSKGDIDCRFLMSVRGQTLKSGRPSGRSVLPPNSRGHTFRKQSAPFALYFAMQDRCGR
jgi:hypothetical protein